MTDADLALIRSVVAEVLRDAGTSDEYGGHMKVAEQLATITYRLGGIEKNTGELAAHQATANHRIEKLEHSAIKAEGISEERQSWLTKTANDQEKRIDHLIRWFGIGLACAGLLSGVVFQVMTKL